MFTFIYTHALEAGLCPQSLRRNAMDIPKPRFLNSTFLPFLFLCLFIKQNSRNKGTLIIKGATQEPRNPRAVYRRAFYSPLPYLLVDWQVLYPNKTNREPWSARFLAQAFLQRDTIANPGPYRFWFTSLLYWRRTVPDNLRGQSLRFVSLIFSVKEDRERYQRIA